MFDAIYPVIGKQTCLPFYVYGVGVSSPEYHIVREQGLLSHQFILTVKGEGKILVDGKEYIAQKGGIFYVASEVTHEYFPVKDEWTTYWITFRGDSLNDLMKRLGFPRYKYGITSNVEPVLQLFDRIYANAGESGEGDEKCSLLVYEYILLMRNILLMDNDKHTGSIIDHAIAFMDNHYNEDISLQKLASICNISEQHFCRLFREKMGMRPMKYLAKKRIAMAKVFLYDTQKSIAEIGREVGYADSTYFGIVFKKYEGITPSEFRKRRGSISM